MKSYFEQRHAVGHAFDKAVLDAIKKWRFTPGIKDGKKVPTVMRLPFSF